MQNLRFLFVLFISQIQFGCCSLAYSNVRCIERERKALLEFKNDLTHLSDRLSSWIGEDCCTWEGVDCNNNTGHVVKLDLRNNISFDPIRYLRDQKYSAYFGNNRLGGKINPSLLNLEHLHYLDLSVNNFSGFQIPSFLGCFKHLRYLNLANSGFDGEIPRQLGNLSNLQHLDLGNAYEYISWNVRPYNNLHVAKSLSWVSQLSSLKRLDLSGVYFGESQDWLHSINMIPSLLPLKLSGCGLKTVSSLSHVNFTSLVSLDLSFNVFNSLFPLWLSNLTSLMDLHLSFNRFHGPIPDMFEQFTSLTFIDLSSNNFNTSIPTSFCKLSSLVHMDLRENSFQGSFPHCLVNLTSLSVLDLGVNEFQGTIPSEIGHLEVLTELILYHNELTGTVPSSLGQLTKLERLEIGSNKFHGSVPSSLWELTELQSLDISNNSLTGVLSERHFIKLQKLTWLSMSSTFLTLNVSFQWIPTFQLRRIDMDSIQIGPRFPSWLKTQKKLETLSMSNASISDVMPDWFEVVHSHINYLDLSHNHISGNPPKFQEIIGLDRVIALNSNNFGGPLKSFPALDIVVFDLSKNSLLGDIPLLDGNMTAMSLEYLVLSDNHLSGKAPDHLCKIQTLVAIDFSNNFLSGSIPLCFGNLQNLVLLDLANNSFRGTIPSALGNLESLVYLHLNRNNFSGKLPSTLQNLKSLEILDLGENQLKDIIPEWIGKKLSNLKFLRIHFNNFYGDIPLHLCQLSSLQVLNLAQNRLTGRIPHCFGNFSAMILNNMSIVVDIGRSSHKVGLSAFMKGRELEYSSNLQYLVSIELSDNNLAEEIPMELMDLVELKNLNLSQNHLTGPIPEKIGNLKRLESLDLSRNELSGPIPSSLATIYSLSYLNFSFNKLSGSIPFGNQLQTLDDPSIYEENSGLCGKPLHTSCPNDESEKGNRPTLDRKDADEVFDFSWFYAAITPGFAVGFLGLYFILLVKKSWRNVYFDFVDNVCTRILIIAGVKSSKLRKRFR